MSSHVYRLDFLIEWKLENFNTLKFLILKNDPWDMLNNFCFHVYAQKWLFIDAKDNAF